MSIKLKQDEEIKVKFGVSHYLANLFYGHIAIIVSKAFPDLLSSVRGSYSQPGSYCTFEAELFKLNAKLATKLSELTDCDVCKGGSVTGVASITNNGRIQTYFVRDLFTETMVSYRVDFTRVSVDYTVPVQIYLNEELIAEKEITQ